MTATNKTLVDVSLLDKDGNKITHTFRLPSVNDWQKNLLSLHKKITKKFDIHHEYALRLKRNIVDRNDYHAIADILKHPDVSDKLPHFDIVDINLLNAPSSSCTTVHKNSQHHTPRRKIIVHFINKQSYTFTLPLDISESDDNLYTQFLTEIRQKLKLKQNKQLTLYEKCNGKHIEIDDWDDLYESLQDKNLSEPVHLYLTVPLIASTDHKQPESDTQTTNEAKSNDTMAAAPIYENKIYLASKDENDSIAQDRTVKIVLLGDSAVGKTSIEQRFVWNRFSEWLEPTVGAMFSRRTLDYGDCRITFEIWDTAGQERFRSLTPLYYRDATAALVVYDITSYRSYDNALKWIHELYGYDDNIVVGLCGNKLDLYAHRKVEYGKAKNWVVKHNIALFAETSAKSNVNITQMFRKIGEVIMKTTKPKCPNGFAVYQDYDGQEFEANYNNGWCYGYCEII